MNKGKNTVIFVLAGLVVFCCILSTSFAFVFVKASKDLRVLQGRAASVESNRNFVRSIAVEAVEYSKRNPAIDPILQAARLKATPTSAKSTK
ncbi:MAG: hypothetical protein ABJC04_00410 [Verrucomicrobiota bacterium]